MNLDFSAILALLTLVSGLVVVLDKVFLAPRRKRGGTSTGQAKIETEYPLIVEYARSFFPIFLIVLVLRSFLVEPFRIPSGSMMPTLLIGDFILVNKYDYGIRLPVINQKVIDMSSPKRGDVVVFRYPEDPSTPFIKRIVGLPGDHITYSNKTLRVNDKEIALKAMGEYEGVGAGESMTGTSLLEEQLDDKPHTILIDPERDSHVVNDFVVPEGNYFVLGDNRDNSRDSRYWGTVPDANLIGRAFMIWMNWDSENGGVAWKRLGTSIQ
jgi:signal peptidase I